MTPTTRKWLHAGAVAFAAFVFDVGYQLMNGSLALTRSVILGVVLGAVGRTVGAMLAALALPEPPAE